MTLSEISIARLFNQRIESSHFKSAKDIVCWMGAMQAQDFAMAKWAVGLRLQHSTEEKIENAISSGEVLRTHLMRPTWHFVSSDDIYWMLDLTAPQIKSALKTRHRQLEFTDAIISKSKNIIARALNGGIHLTREELAVLFNKAKIKTDDNRLYHLLVSAELDGLICSGNIKNSKQTYALLAERVPLKKSLTKEEALAELARRYFTSHGPATLKDFIWWSGLRAADARIALELNNHALNHETIDSENYFFSNTFSKLSVKKYSVHLLPAYDEFLISYRNRSASLLLTDFRKAVSDNGIFRPVIVINGKVCGLWKQVIKKEIVNIETDFFTSHESSVTTEIIRASKAFVKFLNKKTELV